VAACEALYVGPDGLASAKGFSEKRNVYFTASFLSARRYAMNVGGERFDGALRAATGFLGIVRDQQRVKRLQADLEQALSRHGAHPPTERVLANLRDAERVHKLAQQVEEAHRHLRAATQGAHPVVYAVIADRKWLGDGCPPISGWHREPCGGITAREIHADQIVARVDFVNGIAKERP
jgi:hypothetical protein